MESYAFARAESRIQELELEIRRIKSDAQQLRHEIERKELDERAFLC